jgi:hypothetical protein
MGIMARRMALMAIVVGLMGVPAGRAEAGLTYFDFTFSSTTTTNDGYGTLAATANGDGSYTAVSGTLFDNFGLDGLDLVPNPNPPGGATPPNPFFFYDDQLFPGQTQLIDINGLLFGPGGMTGGNMLVLFSNDPGNYSVGYPDETFDFSLTFTLTSVPEPASLALCGIAGVVGLAVARVRRKRVA